MIRYLIFTEKDEGLNIILSDRDKVEDGEVMAIIQKEYQHNFRFLWEMVRERSESLKGTNEEGDKSENCIPFKIYQSNQTDYIIEYDTVKINKLIPLFSLIKAWIEFNGCNAFELRNLY